MQRKFDFAESFEELSGQGAYEMWYSFLFLFGMYSRILVHKFLVHLRTVYASPQKQAGLLIIVIVKTRCLSTAMEVQYDDADDIMTAVMLMMVKIQ